MSIIIRSNTPPTAIGGARAAVCRTPDRPTNPSELSAKIFHKRAFLQTNIEKAARHLMASNQALKAFSAISGPLRGIQVLKIQRIIRVAKKEFHQAVEALASYEQLHHLHPRPRS